MKIRASITLKNEHIVSAMEARGWTQADLAREAGVSPTVVSHLVRMRLVRHPGHRYTPHSPSVVSISETLGILAEDVCPPALVGLDLSREGHAVCDVEPERLAAWVPERFVIQAPDEIVESSSEAAERVHELVSELSEQQRYVIESRFGLGGRPQRTLRELSEEMGCPVHRVQSIELKAHERLRAAAVRARARKIRPLGDEEPEP